MTSTRERPILFRPELVQAILEGRKIQTRRPLKPQPSSVDESGAWYRMPSGGKSLNCYSCPYGEPGDLLWVKETHKRYTGPYQEAEQLRSEGLAVPGSGWPYQARMYLDNPRVSEWERGCMLVTVPSIFMPKWAARIWLVIIDVRVERLMRIDPTDLVREGFWTDGVFDVPDPEVGQALKRQFLDKWQRMYRGTDYDSPNNPWVWVITFKRIEP